MVSARGRAHGGDDCYRPRARSSMPVARSPITPHGAWLSPVVKRGRIEASKTVRASRPARAVQP